MGPRQAPCAVHRFDNLESLDVKALCVITLAPIGRSISASPQRGFIRNRPATSYGRCAPSRLERFLRIGSLIAALFLSLVAGVSLVREASFGWRGVEMPTVVVKAETHAVTLNFGPDDPAHTISVSSHHHWTPGEHVVALCETGEDGRRRCRMQSGFDRWLDGLGTLGLALAAFAVWTYFRRRSSARFTRGT